MTSIRICPGCERLLTTASAAMRRHAEDMHAAVSIAPADLTEERIDQYKIKLIASFDEAQSAWEAYKTHLKEHGVFPVIAPNSQA